MAVKIIIKRRVPRGKEAELVPFLKDLRSLATSQKGYISGETLRNVDDPQDFLVISTWQSLDDWKTWESSNQRADILKKIDEVIGGKTEYGIYYYG